MAKNMIFKCAFAAVCAAVSMGANAQVTAKQTDNKTVALNVVIDNAIEVSLTNSNAVGIRLATASDYRGAVNSSFADKFSVTSNIPYKIEVNTSGANLASGSNTIPVGEITAKITNTEAAAGEVATSGVVLSTTAQALTRNAPATVTQSFSLNFAKTTSNSDAFLKPAGTYTTNLVITATQE